MSGISCTPIASTDSDTRGRDIAPSQRVEVGGWKLEKVVTTRLGDRELGVTWAWGRVESYRLGVLESRARRLEVKPTRNIRPLHWLFVVAGGNFRILGSIS